MQNNYLFFLFFTATLSTVQQASTMLAVSSSRSKLFQTALHAWRAASTVPMSITNTDPIQPYNPQRDQKHILSIALENIRDLESGDVDKKHLALMLDAFENIAEETSNVYLDRNGKAVGFINCTITPYQ
jgi:hypothetical protein